MSACAETDGVARVADTVRLRLRITGLVQGVGFRPEVARIAADHGVTGFVLNASGAVHCEFEGPGERVAAALARLRDAPPPLARIDAIDVETTAPQGDTTFAIRHSDDATTTAARTLVSPDIAICADCLRELFDPNDRRYLHPFITCTNCGPRYTVITDLPYDRPATTMADFAMCQACADEYADPADRATQEEGFSLELRTRDRERKLLKKINETIEKIDEDDYGFCEACGVEIGIRRLEARPTATLCVDCKTLAELKEKQLGG